MNNTSDVLSCCPNYDKIVNFNYKEDDLITLKLIKIYKSYVLSVNFQNVEEKNKVMELDHVLGSYIEDYLFRSTLQKEIIHVSVKKDSNILKSLVDCIIKIFVNYEEYTTRKIYISKWI